MIPRLTIQRILCATDFSDASRQALDRAVRLTRWFEARLSVLHVVSGAGWTVFEPSAAPFGALPIDNSGVLREEAARELERVAASLRGEGLSIEPLLAHGSPAGEILANAEAISADLIVMGKDARRGMERLVLGSVIDKVARRASCPVLVEGNGPPSRRVTPVFRRIVCAADLTSASQRTLKMALSVAEENMARMTLLHVVEDLPAGCDSPYYDEVPSMRHLRRQFVGDARERLERAAGPAQVFCELDVRVETGLARKEILRIAKETYADLIVVGVHSGGTLAPAILGSTASHILREAACPVLMIGPAVRRPLETTYSPAVERATPAGHRQATDGR